MIILKTSSSEIGNMSSSTPRRGIFGIEPKNPEIEDHDLFPSLQQLAGQAFAWTLVRRLIVDQDVTEMHWASDEWKNFRLS